MRSRTKPHRRQERAGTRRNAAARAGVAMDAGDGVLIFIAIRISDGYTL